MTNTTIELTGSRQSPCVVNHRVQKPLLILHRVIPSDPNLLDQVVAEVTQAIERTPTRPSWDDAERIGLAVREGGIRGTLFPPSEPALQNSVTVSGEARGR